MNARRITEITLETEETFTIRRSAGAIRVPCPVCGSVLALVTPGNPPPSLGSISKLSTAGLIRGAFTSSNPPADRS